MFLKIHRQVFPFFCWFLVFAHMGLLFYLSHQPSIPVEPLFPHQDKAFHGIAYGILGFFLCQALHLSKVKTWFLLAIVISSLYGISDEFHQSFVPGRDSSAADWVADTLGAGMAALVYRSFLRWRKNELSE